MLQESARDPSIGHVWAGEARLDGTSQKPRREDPVELNHTYKRQNIEDVHTWSRVVKSSPVDYGYEILHE